jgi:hypothetical protein
MKNTTTTPDYTLEQLEVIWLEYQQIGQATCPIDGVRLEIELVNHPAEDQPEHHSDVAEVYVKSPRGKSAIYRPSDSTVRAWSE